jgi:dTDP-4-amino-4,6-dideoxygalactose transaminase
MISVPLNRMIGEEDHELNEINSSIQEVIKSGLFIQGPHHKAFEDEFAKFTGAKFAIGVASGTDALILALKSLGIGAGSEIVCAANAGGYASLAAKSIGAVLKYCDVDIETGLITSELLEQVITPQTSAVVVTHLFGNVLEIDKILSLCNKNRVPLIEDCAQASGARCADKHVGTFGDIGIFSFYPTKNLGAIGDGGILITNNEILAKKLFSLRQYGWSLKYNIDIPGGMNSRLDELQAAILRVKLRSLDIKNRKRLQIIGSYQEAFKPLGLRLLTSGKPGNVAHLAVLLLPISIDRDEFRNNMRNLGVETDVHYPLLDTEQIGLNMGDFPGQIPNSQELVNKIVSIPIFPQMTLSEMSTVIDAVIGSVNKSE